MIGRPFWSLPVGDVAQKIREALRRVQAASVAETIRDVPFTLPDGQSRRLVVQVTPLQNRDRATVGAMAVVALNESAR